MSAAPKAGPHPVDVAVGAKVAELRKFRGLNQSDLGRALGLTFQQVQKYERGANRISCSKLVGIARTLSVTPAYFFAEDAEAQADAVLPVAIPPRMIRAMGSLSSRRLTLLADLAVTLASEAQPQEAHP